MPVLTGVSHSTNERLTVGALVLVVLVSLVLAAVLNPRPVRFRPMTAVERRGARSAEGWSACDSVWYT